MKSLHFLFILLVFAGCKKSPDATFEKLDANHTNIHFINKIEESEKDNVLNYEYFYNGGRCRCRL